MLLDELVQIVEDFTLPFGKRKHLGISSAGRPAFQREGAPRAAETATSTAPALSSGTIRKRKAKVNAHFETRTDTISSSCGSLLRFLRRRHGHSMWSAVA